MLCAPRHAVVIAIRSDMLYTGWSSTRTYRTSFALFGSIFVYKFRFFILRPFLKQKVLKRYFLVVFRFTSQIAPPPERYKAFFPPRCFIVSLLATYYCRKQSKLFEQKCFLSCTRCRLINHEKWFSTETSPNGYGYWSFFFSNFEERVWFIDRYQVRIRELITAYSLVSRVNVGFIFLFGILYAYLKRHRIRKWPRRRTVYNM